MKIALTAITLALLAQSATPQAKTPPKPSSRKSAPVIQRADAKFKAIWEPANVKEDLELYSVRFTGPDEGWVAGGRNELNGGVIYHTKDGGRNWELQLGDPQSSDRAYRDLRFLNSNTGFAVQSTGVGDHLLLRTTDGQTWTPSGTVPQHREDYQFVSSEIGFAASGERILKTQNGGRQWQPVYSCAVRAEVGGLTRDVRCSFEKLYFLNQTTGFALSHSIGNNAGSVLAKTEDGGNTWTAWLIIPGEDGKEGGLFFFDANTGILRTLNGKLFRTTDGGKTWTGVPGQANGKPEIQFADSQVGWMVRYSDMIYTINGGRQWVSRQIPFPAQVAAFSLVERDRGYAVGDHGMVYRYNIVPIDYAAKGALAAPAMPAK